MSFTAFLLRKWIPQKDGPSWIPHRLAVETNPIPQLRESSVEQFRGVPRLKTSLSPSPSECYIKLHQ
jgi:hypothetical protein